jgi:hypothetical protein
MHLTHHAAERPLENMKQLVSERIRELRREIAEISEANRKYFKGPRYGAATNAEQERRLERLQAIMDELIALTDWKKP